MTTTTQLIAQLQGLGVRLWHEGDQLRYRAPAGVMTAERLADLRAHKAGILQRLRQESGLPDVRPDPAARHEPFPLTDVQAAYLLGRNDAFDYGEVACHGYMELAVSELDEPRLEDAWNRLIARHDMLRAVIHPDGYQQVLPEVPRQRIPVTGDPEEVRAELSQRVYRTDQWPLFDLRATPGRLHFSIDLLIADYLSIQRLLTELDELYRDPDRERPELELTFRDYVMTERSTRQAGADRYERDRDYWWSRLDDLPPAPELPRAEGDGAGFERHTVTIDAGRWAALRRRAAEENLTPSAAVLAGYAEVVGRWSGSPAFTLNLTLLNRLPLHPQVDVLVGDFTSLSLLAVEPAAPEAGFADRARDLQARLMTDLDHRTCSGVEVMRELARRKGRAAALMPVVYTSTIGLDQDAEAPPPGSLLAEPPVAGLSQTPQVWLDCQAIEQRGMLVINWDVRAGVFPDGMIEDAFAAFTALLDRLAAGLGWHEHTLVPLPEPHRQRREAANDTAAPLPDGLLHEAVVAQALAAPARSAVITPDRTLTFGGLLAEATAVAAALQDVTGQIVAVSMPKSAEQVSAVLGVLLAGAAYLPLDDDLPARRRETILRDAGARHVLTCSGSGAQWPDDVRVIEVDALEATGHEPPPASRAHPDDLAYVIYTSGSTGAPKGVMTSHRAALNTVQDINQRFDVGYGDRVLGLAGLGFDLSVYDIFGPLAVGGALVLPDPARRADPSHWAELIAQHAVSLWNSVPAQLQMLQHYLATTPAVELFTLRLGLLSGDWIPVGLPGAIRARLPLMELVSLGGATEASIWSIAYPIDEVPAGWRSIPYGRPLANQTFHVLDAQLRPRPEWVAGELYIGGAGLAQGYLGDPERTAERFIVHPELGRLYRTGDHGRYLPSGDIEFLGRTDTQVKIRGHRVELGEVEAVLAEHPAVAAAVALVDGDDPLRRRLVAFAQVAAGAKADETERAAVADAGIAAAEKGRAAEDLTALTAFVDLADRAALIAMAAALRGAGLFAHHQDAHTLPDIAAMLAVAPQHQRLLRRWLAALTADGLLHRDGEGRYHGLALATPELVEERLAVLDERAAAFDFGGELVTYLRASAAALPELLRGEANPLELMFPGASTETARAAFRDNPVNRYLNDVLVAAVTALGRPLRVLEVGAGVGGTSAALIPALAELDVEVDYLFTDVSPFFLNDAREAFAAYPWVRYGLYDLNLDPRAQDLQPNSFDLIVAGNALHLAKDAAAALAALRELLASGGWLAFIEGTAENLPLMVSMEFTEQLTGFTDLRQAADQTLLTREQWTELIEEAGGELTLAAALTGEGRSLLGQHVFVARFKADRTPVTVPELEEHLRARLPEHMAPAHLQLLDALPLTANGKIDRATLLGWATRPDEDEASAPAAEPLDELEARLIVLWGEVLGHGRLGRGDDFFVSGGDSLLLARLVGQMIEREPLAAGHDFGAVLGQVLRRPTVAAMAAYLRSTPGEAGAEYSPLLTLNEGDGVSTVLVHEGTGSLAPYRGLVTALTTATPGLRLLGLEPGHAGGYAGLDADGLIERLAGEHAQRLIDAGIDRVRLVGYCMGGLIATETARILTEAGVTVDALTVISSYRVPYEVEDDLVIEYAFARVLGADLAALGYPTDDRLMAAAMETAVAGTGRLPDGAIAALNDRFADLAAGFRRLGERRRSERLAAIVAAMPAGRFPVDEGYLETMYQVFRHNLRAIARFRPDPYAGDITLLRDGGLVQLLPPMQEEMTAYWQEVCLGELRIVDIPGDHFTCMSSPHVETVGRILGQEWSPGVSTDE
ncbi:amino acid adenylation domain-containing protein [Nonomuraea turkmeniaca]|uniref:Phenyloxazoline synthase MbtB n=1 Tax=Nonomuraea turkmeniaca TaxID=103838 RepID=A0A5S4FVW3_9ACTN|nr:amino acid adenylation domain-containing protein [Nonomuraea turkmeniaca]TMR24783.1 amino acid adenylation domain-containing protein [Nonomuraea turkmeniaca]